VKYKFIVKSIYITFSLVNYLQIKLCIKISKQKLKKIKKTRFLQIFIENSQENFPPNKLIGILYVSWKYFVRPHTTKSTFAIFKIFVDISNFQLNLHQLCKNTGIGSVCLLWVLELGKERVKDCSYMGHFTAANTMWQWLICVTCLIVLYVIII